MFVHIGFGNYVNVDKVIAVTPATSMPIQRLKKHAETSCKLIECTAGRKTRGLLHMDGGFVVTSTLATDTLVDRIR
jgi:regulator of extracellular matrix RemA (YlzA/DUF370 family)